MSLPFPSEVQASVRESCPLGCQVFVCTGSCWKVKQNPLLSLTQFISISKATPLLGSNKETIPRPMFGNSCKTRGGLETGNLTLD